MLFHRLLYITFMLEIFFSLLMVVACLICFINPKGWTTFKGSIVALLLFVGYMLVNIIYYPTFSAAYLTGFNPQYSSSAGALVGFKLVLAIIGVIAGIPISVEIDKYEYSRRLREKAEEQRANWAKESAIGAKKDLESTLANLKSKMSEEELAELLSELNKSTEESINDKKDVLEDWQGWGRGI